MQTPPNNQDYETDEIDISQLVVALWQGKWLVLGVTSLVVFLTLLFVLLVPRTYEGTLPIKTISAIDEKAYQALSTFELLTIDADLLSSTFYAVLDTKDTLVEAMTSANYVSPLSDETQDEFQYRVLTTAGKDFALQPVLPDAAKSRSQAQGDKENNGVVFLDVHITSKQPALAFQLIVSTLTKVNDAVRAKLTNALAAQMVVYQQGLEAQLHDLHTEEAHLLNQLHEGVLLRKEQLQLHASIARDLDLAKGLYIQLVQNKSGAASLENITETMPHYSQGYIALEKELALLDDQSLMNMSSIELEAVQLKINSLENDKTVLRAKHHVDTSPLVHDDFAAVRYDVGALDLQPKVSHWLLLALSMVMGGMLGVIVLVLRNALSQKTAG